MSSDEVDHFAEACRKALERLGSSGSFRLRTLISMVLRELQVERAARGRRDNQL